MIGSKRLPEDSSTCFSPKVSTKTPEISHQAPAPTLAPDTTPSGVQFGGSGDKLVGMNEAKVNPAEGKESLTVKTTTPTANTGSSAVKTTETAPTAFDKLRRVQRQSGTAVGNNSWSS